MTLAPETVRAALDSSDYLPWILRNLDLRLAPGLRWSQVGSTATVDLFHDYDSRPVMRGNAGEIWSWLASLAGRSTP